MSGAGENATYALRSDRVALIVLSRYYSSAVLSQKQKFLEAGKALEQADFLTPATHQRYGLKNFQAISIAFADLHL